MHRPALVKDRFFTVVKAANFAGRRSPVGAALTLLTAVFIGFSDWRGCCKGLGAIR
jgi:hypothetical protein